MAASRGTNDQLPSYVDKIFLSEKLFLAVMKDSLP